jgi:hypothetical protein
MQARTPTLLDVALNMMMLALVAFVAHARLAAERPGVAHLTALYLVLSLGGALGGLLNGMVAPVLFDRVLEYPVVTVLAPLAVVPARQARAAAVQVAGTRTLTRIAVLVMAVVFAAGVGAVLSRWADHMPLAYVGLAMAFLAGWLLSTSRTVVVMVLALIFTGVTARTERGTVEYRRTFFGSYRVFEGEGQHKLAHGTTVHGTQWLDERRSEPTTYYARSGPLGDVFGLKDIQDIGEVGLGVGTVAAYGTSGQHLTFFEIDPEIVEVARDPAVFTYLTKVRPRSRPRWGTGG